MATPTPNEPLNGVLYGIAGALALRADFAAGPRRDTARRDQLTDARSALTLGIAWTTTLLDDVTARRAEAWLMGMPDDRLCEEALRVQADIRMQPGTVVPDKAKKQLFEMLVVAMEQLGEDDTHRASRAQLITFCTRYSPSDTSPRPPMPCRPAAPATHAWPPLGDDQPQPDRHA